MRVVLFKYSLQTCPLWIDSRQPLHSLYSSYYNVAVFTHNASTISLGMGYKDTFVCACFIDGCFMATSVTHMGTKAINPWLTCTEKVAHKLTCFEHTLKTLFYSEDLFPVDGGVR